MYMSGCGGHKPPLARRRRRGRGRTASGRLLASEAPVIVRTPAGKTEEAVETIATARQTRLVLVLVFPLRPGASALLSLATLSATVDLVTLAA